MKFSHSALTVLFLTGHASAWTTTARIVPRRAFAAVQLHSVATETAGEAATESFRLKFKDGEKAMSPWHDIDLKNDDGSYNMVVEIPKMTKAKMEVATKEEFNPIAQDIKKGKLRDYHGPIFWNYGCLPQTWEDPTVKHPELGCFGDDDPIDVVEIGSASLGMGSVKSVKPLGVLAMIDDGELDWKVLAIATDDPLAEKYNDIGDVPESVQAGIREWFRWYKTPDDKPINEFGFDEKYLDKAEAIKVIEETNDAWKKLKAGETEAGKLWIGE
jgi:inorganic pyrophosphatase